MVSAILLANTACLPPEPDWPMTASTSLPSGSGSSSSTATTGDMVGPTSSDEASSGDRRDVSSSTMDASSSDETTFDITTSDARTNTSSEASTSTIDEGSSSPTIDPPQPWWNGAWPCRIPFTITASALPAPIDDVAVPARLETRRLAPTLLLEDGSDVRVVAEDHATILPFEVDHVPSRESEAEGELVVWIGASRLEPDVSRGGWLYYGNPEPSGGNPPSPWGSAYDAVLHLGTSLEDSTGAHSGLAYQEPTTSAGRVGLARSFSADQAGRVVRLDDSRDFAWESGFSLSFWTLVEGTSNNFSRRGLVGSTAWGLEVYDVNSAFPAGAPLSFRLRVQCTTSGLDCSAIEGGLAYALEGSVARAGAWHHVALVYAQEMVSLYLDGRLMSVTPLDIEFVRELHSLTIGMDPASTRSAFGDIDEFRFYDGVWSPDRIAADYAVVERDFVEFGDPECYR